MRRIGMGRAPLALLVLLTGVTTSTAAWGYARTLQSNGWQLVDVPLLFLFVVLFSWIGIGFWTATFGFVRNLLRPDVPFTPDGEHPPADPGTGLPPTAIVMPIHKEDPRRVFAGLRAIRESLEGTGRAASFDFFVLSDTADPEIWVREEQAWARMRASSDGSSGLFYRRRAENLAHKAGNIRDFCERWGAQYRYMVVLDADSLMSGGTLVEMVRRMERRTDVGILQVPPRLVNGESLFARLLQFASAVYGGIFRSGFALWTREEGNYWGHNAILRVRPFMECCGLPTLPGPAPWGGEILSHDFVEAALMLRKGWKVVIASDLDGSYEECPANLVDFAKRDQRWSQGNLQHVPLSLSPGLRSVSRFHLGMGALSYLASPLWALFMLLCLVESVGSTLSLTPTGLEVDAGAAQAPVWHLPLGGALLMLLLVKVWALAETLPRPGRARCFGGRERLAAGVLLETALSFILAPVLMAFHTTFVVSTLLGHKVEWEPQRRGENRITYAEAFRVHSPHTIAGLGALLLVTWLSPGLVWWSLPILVGLTVSVPLSLVLSSVPAGARLRAAGLFLIPEEIAPPPVVARKRALLEQEIARGDDAPHPFAQVVADPVLLGLHIALLPPGPSPLADDPERRSRLQRIALSGGASHVTRAERLLLLQDREALRWLHREAWKDWPLDLLQRAAR